jgi:hypothetical protein
VEKALRTGTLTPGDGAALMEGFAYIYKDGPVPVLGIGRSGSADVSHANEEQYAIPFVITTLEEDRDGDIVVPMGWHGQNYARNPVWFFGHQQWEISIGKSIGPDGKLYVFPEEKLIKSVCFFDQHDEDAMYIYGKVMRGYLNATSIAFVPIDAARRDNEYGYEKARTHSQSMMPLGWLFKEWDHTETSIVGVGSNAGAIRDSLDKEWMYITPKCRKALGSYAAQAKGCWNGWCPSPPCQPCQKTVRKETRPRLKADRGSQSNAPIVYEPGLQNPQGGNKPSNSSTHRVDTAYALDKAGATPTFMTGDKVVATHSATSDIPLDRVGTVVDTWYGTESLHDPEDVEGARGELTPPPAEGAQWQQPDYGPSSQAPGARQVPLTQKPGMAGSDVTTTPAPGSGEGIASSSTQYLVDFGDRKVWVSEESIEQAPAKGGEVKQGAAGTTLGQVILPGDPAAQYAIPNRLKRYKTSDRIDILRRHQQRKSLLGPMAGS